MGNNDATILIILNDEMKDIIEIVKSLEDSSLLLKWVSGIIQNEAKEQKEGFLSVLVGTLSASLLGNILAEKGMNSAGEEIVRVGYWNKKSLKNNNKKQNGFLMPPHVVLILEIIYLLK